MEKIHIWIGVFSKNEEEYFNQDDAPSQFCTDIDIEEYDEDFIGIIPLFNKEVDIITLLNEVPINEDNIPEVIDNCSKLGISKGNAIFYLTDSSIIIQDENKTYNDLKYIGVFNSSL